MENGRVSIVLVLSYMVLLQYVQCSKVAKLEKGINFLKEKLSTLEESVFHDKMEVYDEIQIIWKMLNSSDERVDDQDETKGSRADEHKFVQGEYRGSEMRKLLKTVNERIVVLLKGFKDEKKNIRRVLNELESQYEVMKDKQDNAVKNISDFASDQLTFINKTLREENGIAMEHIQRTLYYLKAEQEKVISHLKDNAEKIHADLGLKGLVEVQERTNNVQDTANVYSAKFDKLQETVSDIQDIVRCGGNGWTFYQNTCYHGRISKQKAGRYEAKSECTKMGAVLLSILEDAFLVESNNLTSTWIGNGRWLFIDCTIFSDGHMISGVHICDEQHHFICKKQPLN